MRRVNKQEISSVKGLKKIRPDLLDSKRNDVHRGLIARLHETVEVVRKRFNEFALDASAKEHLVDVQHDSGRISRTDLDNTLWLKVSDHGRQDYRVGIAKLRIIIIVSQSFF